MNPHLFPVPENVQYHTTDQVLQLLVLTAVTTHTTASESPGKVLDTVALVAAYHSEGIEVGAGLPTDSSQTYLLLSFSLLC